MPTLAAHLTTGATLGQSALPGMLMSVGALLAGLAVWFSLRKKLKASFARSRESTGDRLDRIRANHHAASSDRNRIENLMTDAEELTRRLASLLDAKAERVERLLDLADRRLAELEGRVVTKPVRPASAGQPQAAPAPRADTIRYEPADPVAVDVYRLADAGRQAIEIAKELGEHTGKVELILALRD